MKYFQVDAIMNKEFFTKFLEFCNDNQDEWTIFLNSDGGNENTMRAMLLIINERKEKCRLVSKGIFSAAFELFYRAECLKILTTSSVGMYHFARNTIEVNVDNKRTYYYDDCIYKRNRETSHEYALNFAKQFMTQAELKKFKKGNDVYFTFKRMKEIFPDAEII